MTAHFNHRATFTRTPSGMLSIHDLALPLSQKNATAREQLSAMFAAGEFDALPNDTRYALRGLELFLLGASQDAFDLENAARVTSRERRRVPAWMRWGRM